MRRGNFAKAINVKKPYLASQNINYCNLLRPSPQELRAAVLTQQLTSTFVCSDGVKAEFQIR